MKLKFSSRYHKIRASIFFFFFLERSWCTVKWGAELPTRPRNRNTMYVCTYGNVVSNIKSVYAALLKNQNALSTRRTDHDKTVSGPQRAPASRTVGDGHGLAVHGDHSGWRFAHGAPTENDTTGYSSRALVAVSFDVSFNIGDDRDAKTTTASAVFNFARRHRFTWICIWQCPVPRWASSLWAWARRCSASNCNRFCSRSRTPRSGCRT